MTAIPLGMLSFLYNVMYDREMNENFRKDPYKVMEFFQLSDQQQKFVETAGEEIVARRLEKEAALAARQEVARAKGAEAGVKAIKWFSDTVPVAEIENIVETLHQSRGFQSQLQKLVLRAVAEELKKGHGHFW